MHSFAVLSHCPTRCFLQGALKSLVAPFREVPFGLFDLWKRLLLRGDLLEPFEEPFEELREEPLLEDFPPFDPLDPFDPFDEPFDVDLDRL